MQKKESNKTKVFFAMLLAIALFGIYFSSFAQVANNFEWSRQGNLAGPPGPNNLAHTFGTFFNQPINIFTNSIQRGVINNGNGFWGVGNFTAPQSLLHLHNSTVPNANTPQVVYTQWTIDGAGTGTGNTANDGFRIGVRSFFNTNTNAFESDAQLIQPACGTGRQENSFAYSRTFPELAGD